jgi:hypothetical protein
MNNADIRRGATAFLFSFWFCISSISQARTTTGASEAEAVDFITSNLPILLIDTNGRTIPDEPKIDATLKIIDNGPGAVNHVNDPATEYDGQIGIEVRGASSAGYPQKPYAFETRNPDGTNLNVSLFGMPEENDWLLISNYNDKSFVRNALAFDLFRAMGHYAPRSLLCEVAVNSVYRGVYLFCEKIKRDKARVDIADLGIDENSGDALTGGYIIKVDYHDANNSWKSNYSPPGHPGKSVYFVYYYPDPEAITASQKSYIQDFIDAAETALRGDQFADPHSGYRNYFDVSSFIDYFIISEVSRNVDGYKKSRFFYKDKDSKDGLLHSGPVWDFDWAWKNIAECIYSATDGSGWSYKTNDCPPDNYCPGWYVRLLQDGYFTNRLIDRYFTLRVTLLDLDRINAYIDSVQTYVNEAQARHFALWPIDRNYSAPEVDQPSQSYDEEIAKLKEWIRRRIVWLDENIPLLREEIQTTVKVDATVQIACRIFPNPARTDFFVESDVPIREINIYNVLGQRVYAAESKDRHSEKIPIHNFHSGIYVIEAIRQDGSKIVQRQIFQK